MMNMNNYSPAVYLSALRHCAGTAAARGAASRREAARNAGIVNLTIAAVLQAAEDVTARRAEIAPETISAAIAPEAARRPRFDIGEIARRASADYADMLTIDPSARSLPLWRHCLRSAAADIKAEKAAGTIAEYLRLPGDQQYETLRRAAYRVPVWAARARHKVDPKRAADLLPPARWILYSSGDRTPSAAADDREIVYRSDRDYRWIEQWGREGRREDAIETIAGEAWVRIASRIDAGKIAPADPAWITIYRETMQAAAGIGRSLRDQPARQKADAPSIDDPTYTAAARFPSPEAEIVARLTIDAAARDDLDLTILRAIEYGLDQPEIAARTGVSQSTISRRLRHMASRIASAPAAEAAAAPAPVPAPAIREVPGDPGLASPAARLYARSLPAPEKAPEKAPEAVLKASDVAARIRAREEEDRRLRPVYAAADRRASRSLERLAAARREEEDRRRAADVARAAVPAKIVPPASPAEAARRARYAARIARAR